MPHVSRNCIKRINQKNYLLIYVLYVQSGIYFLVDHLQFLIALLQISALSWRFMNLFFILDLKFMNNYKPLSISFSLILLTYSKVTRPSKDVRYKSLEKFFYSRSQYKPCNNQKNQNLKFLVIQHL
ncbi:hypothetical protein RHAB15C_0000132 [Candidatus Rhabdochlamydia porcellionis]|uniref:Transmembrane protein n=1 Tax=Candidatus Rhabdochlamydia porcellionis TaxID=225148 RepID=A0ABX8YY89_9BACT|nr:hypothetical protein RHAB15C_0000132 [Candidatus Rhabdochlamydia porcellionis]